MPYTILGALGVRVIEVENLGREAQYLPDTQILIVDQDLTADRSERLTCLLLPRLFDRTPTPAQENPRPVP